jgi:inosose dehydratase
VAIYDRWAERIPYLHLKDLEPARLRADFWASIAAGAFRPLGEGAVDLAALGGALAEHGYDGWATIEQDRVRGGGTPLADLRRSLRTCGREEGPWSASASAS